MNNTTPVSQAIVPSNGKGKVQSLRKEGKLSRILGGGFVAIDAYGRYKDGDSVPVAIGKAALTNAAWNLLPGGLAAMAAVTALQAAPELMRMTDAAKGAIGAKSVAFGSAYTQNEGQAYMQQMGVNNGLSARQAASAAMVGHARAASRSY